MAPSFAGLGGHRLSTCLAGAARNRESSSLKKTPSELRAGEGCTSFGPIAARTRANVGSDTSRSSAQGTRRNLRQALLREARRRRRAIAARGSDAVAPRMSCRRALVGRPCGRARITATPRSTMSGRPPRRSGPTASPALGTGVGRWPERVVASFVAASGPNAPPPSGGEPRLPTS